MLDVCLVDRKRGNKRYDHILIDIMLALNEWALILKLSYGRIDI